MSIIYVSCAKSSASIDDGSLKKNEKHESVEIAFFDKEENDIKLTFSRDEFEKMISPVVDSLLGKDFVYEYISVVDDYIWEYKDSPTLQISLFNIEEGASYNLFLFDDIYKTIGMDGVKYYMKGAPSGSGSDGWSFVVCKSTDCGNGCKRNGKECTACPQPNDSNIKPHCEKTEKSVWEVLVGPITTIIAALIALCK